MKVLPLFPGKRKILPTINTIVIETERGCISIIDHESLGLRITAGNIYNSTKEEYYFQIYDWDGKHIGLYNDLRLELGSHQQTVNTKEVRNEQKS